MIRGIVASICAVSVVWCAPTPADAQAKGKLTPGKYVRLPAYGEDNPELTAERLDDMERRLRAAGADEKKHAAAEATRQKWEKCRKDVRASMKPREEERRRQDNAQAKAQVEATQAERQRLSAELQKRMKEAKTTEEKQQIMSEYGAKLGALTPSSKGNQRRSSRESEQEVAARCGEQPAGTTAHGPNDYPGAPRGFPLMLERTVDYCRQGPKYVGSDGAISTSDQPFNPKERTIARDYHVGTYSPREAAELEKRCTKLKPLLEARGHWG